MKVSQSHWRSGVAGEAELADLVLVFGGRAQLESIAPEKLAARFPGAILVGCSTAGEIHEVSVSDDSIVATAVKLERGRVRATECTLEHPTESEAAGRRLATALCEPDLVHVLVFSDGLHVNGSALAKGLAEALPPGVHATGGLSADGAAFKRTLVLNGLARGERRVVAVGFYGPGLQVGFGSVGGWDPFGPDRQVTRSAGNVLYELDGQSALTLYKKYLGEHAKGLPASGLLFPLAVRDGDAQTVVRTILSVDEATQSLTFAGDVPQGSWARLMKANFDRLIDGAHEAAESGRRMSGPIPPQLALLVSCVGRKLVLNQRVEEEVESVRQVVGPAATMAGFYSYGELCPAAPNADCQLHNQTMTVTTFAEG
jgi:hypothetical protein